MATKLKWEDIYKDFRRRYPSTRDKILNWRPYGFATIEVKLKDGTVFHYNYDDARAVFVVKGENYGS